MYIPLVSIEKSNLDGMGVFTQEDIIVHERVWVFTEDYDQRINNTEFQQLSEKEKLYLSRTAYFSQWSKMWVYPPKGDAAEYTNHNNDHNLSVRFDESISSEPFFIANRNIAKGEELTNNYHEFDEMTRKIKPDWASQKF